MSVFRFEPFRAPARELVLANMGVNFRARLGLPPRACIACMTARPRGAQEDREALSVSSRSGAYPRLIRVCTGQSCQRSGTRVSGR